MMIMTMMTMLMQMGALLVCLDSDELVVTEVDRTERLSL